MVAKKTGAAAAPKKAAAGKGKAVALWDAKLAELAKRQQATEASQASGGNRIGTRAATFTIDGGVIPGGKFKAIVVDSILENDYYEGKFDADNPSSPVCYAYGRKDGEMAPHEDSSQPQAEACHGCPNNEWASAEQGRGKACANRRKLILVCESDFGDLQNAQMRVLMIPPTSAANWKGYVDSIFEHTKNKATCAVVTEISIAPHPKKQQELSFKLIEEIDDPEALEAIITHLLPKAEKDIVAPYPKFDEEEATSRKLPPRKAAGSAKPAPGKKAAPAKAGAPKFGKKK